MKVKMTKEERREQREYVDERLAVTRLVRLALIRCADDGNELPRILKAYDKAVLSARATIYQVDNEVRFGGTEKRRERARRKGK